MSLRILKKLFSVTCDTFGFEPFVYCIMIRSIFRKNNPPSGRIYSIPKIKVIDYQSITTLARRWYYTLQIKQIFKKFKTQKFKIQITQNEKLN